MADNYWSKPVLYQNQKYLKVILPLGLIFPLLTDGMQPPGFLGSAHAFTEFKP